MLDRFDGWLYCWEPPEPLPERDCMDEAKAEREERLCGHRVNDWDPCPATHDKEETR